MGIAPKGQREQILLLVMVIAFGALFAFWYLSYSPKQSALEEKEKRVETLVGINQRAKAELAKGSIADLRRQLVEYQQNLDLVRTLVPTSNEVPALLSQVSTAARRVGLDVATVDPQPVTEGDQYDTYRYNVGVLGGFHELAEFLTNVGSLPRIVLPTNLQLTVQPNVTRQVQHPKKSGVAVIEAKLQLQTYVARKTPPVEAEPKKAGSG